MALYRFRLRDHVQGADNPLLIFPEGTCVNNHYTVMFKKVIVSFLVSSVVCKFNKRVRLWVAVLKLILWILGAFNL